MRYWVASAILLLVSNTFLSAQSPPSAPVQAEYLNQAPVIDGKLDEPAWQHGSWQGGDLRVLDFPDKQPRSQTLFKIAHDTHYLYFAHRLSKPADAKLKAEATTHDGPVWYDDCIEMMVDPYGSRQEYFHYLINSKGIVADFRRHQGGFLRDIGWNSNIKAAVQVSELEWTVEVAIPLADLQLTAESLKPWLFNVCRATQFYSDGTVDNIEYSSYGPATGGFHQPADFVLLELVGAKIHPYLLGIESPVNVRVVKAGSGYAYEADVFINNQSGDYRFITLQAELHSGDKIIGNATVSAGLDDKLKRPLPIKIEFTNNGNARLKLLILDKETKQPLTRRELDVELAYSPMTIRFDRPSYRDSIYATQKLTAVEGKVTSALSQMDMNSHQMRIELKSGDRILATVSPDKLELVTPFVLPLPELEAGAYDVVATLLNSKGELVYSNHRTLHKLPPAPAVEVRLDENLVTRINGEPYFPFGWFSIPYDMFDVVGKQGYNFMVCYNAHHYETPRLEKYLNDAAAAGIKMAIYAWPRTPIGYGEEAKTPLTDSEADEIRQHIRRIKHHPNLIAWYVGDEPTQLPMLPARLQAIYQILREEDPYRPAILLHNEITGMYKYPDCTDIQMPDPYPLFVHGGFAARPVEYISRFLVEIPKLGDGRQGMWVTPQGFSYGDFGLRGNRQPTFDEVRLQTYQSVINGTTGFCWYSRYYIQSYTDLLIAMDWQVKETMILKDAILAVQGRQKLKVEGANHLLMTDYRKVGDDYYLFVVNNNIKPTHAKFLLPDDAPKRWYVVSEARQVEAVDGVIEDTFTHYDTNIYTTNREIAHGLAVSEPLSEIKTYQDGLKAKGNLVHRDYATEIDVSSAARLFSTRLLHDGFLESDFAKYSPADLGVYDLHKFTGQKPAQLPEWVQVRFAEPTEIARVVLYAKNVTEAVVQMQVDGQWVDQYPMSKDKHGILTAVFEPVDVFAFRISITQIEGDVVHLEEVEAYAK